MQHKPCLISMRKTKYGLVELTRRKLSCPHSKVLAQYYLDTLERVEVTSEQEDESNENTESKNGTPPPPAPSRLASPAHDACDL